MLFFVVCRFVFWLWSSFGRFFRRFGRSPFRFVLLPVRVFLGGFRRLFLVVFCCPSASGWGLSGSSGLWLRRSGFGFVRPVFGLGRLPRGYGWVVVPASRLAAARLSFFVWAVRPAVVARRSGAVVAFWVFVSPSATGEREKNYAEMGAFAPIAA